MKINANHFLEIEAGDRWNIEIKPSPNVKAGMVPEKVVIANTNRARLADAVRNYQTPHAASYHLLLGRNGLDLVQMVPFDHQARCTLGYEPGVIAIALDYTQQANTGEVLNPGEYITAVARNNKHVRVPTFPREQLDGLLDLLATLHSELGVDTVTALSEIYEPGSMPGPSFPMIQLREQLFNRTNGSTQGRMALDEVTSPAVLRILELRYNQYCI